jgi:transposase
MHRHELSDEQWERLSKLLPSEKPNTGRPSKDLRRVVNGILWILRTGAPWRDLPERYGPWTTVSNRFYRWRRAGIWDRVLSELQREADILGEIDWTVRFVDSTMVRAHQHSSGGKRGTQRERRSA